MEKSELKKWVQEVTQRLPKFLEALRDDLVRGRFRYSLTGDMVTDTIWGLGNTVFATKTYYMLSKLSLVDAGALTHFINSFQNDDGEIFDPIIQKKSKLYRYFNATETRFGIISKIFND